MTMLEIAQAMCADLGITTQLEIDGTCVTEVKIKDKRHLHEKASGKHDGMAEAYDWVTFDTFASAFMIPSGMQAAMAKAAATGRT